MRDVNFMTPPLRAAAFADAGITCQKRVKPMWSARRMNAPTLAGLGIAFVVLFIAFRVVELFRRRERRLPVFHRGLFNDLAYRLFTPYVTRAITTVCVVVVAAPFALLIHGKLDFELLKAGFGRLSRWPYWLQARDKNFAGLLPLWDMLFGTCHMPRQGARQLRHRDAGAGRPVRPARLAVPAKRPGE